MKHLLLLILFTTGLSAQTFDFSCDPGLGNIGYGIQDAGADWNDDGAQLICVGQDFKVTVEDGAQAVSTVYFNVEGLDPVVNNGNEILNLDMGPAVSQIEVVITMEGHTTVKLVFLPKTC